MELSGTEIVVIFLIALLVLGPDEMVKYAVRLGRFAAKMRTQFENFKKMTQEELVKRADLDKEFSLGSLGEIRNQMKGLEGEMNKSLSGDLGTEDISHPKKSEILPADAIENNLMGMTPKGSNGEQ